MAIFLGGMFLGAVFMTPPVVIVDSDHHCHLFCEAGAAVHGTAHFIVAVPVETGRFAFRTAGRTVEYGGGLVKETGRLLGGVGSDLRDAGRRLRRRF